MNYRVRYIPNAEAWAIDHWAWLTKGRGDREGPSGPWVQVATRPTEVDAWRYIADVQRRQHELAMVDNPHPHPLVIHMEIPRKRADIPASSTCSAQATTTSLSTP